ncbi:polyphosphate polymerase domain-containing protein [Paenibacillus sp. MZ04-78.2]|uniref:polyphosphate polymerase domain-containing protein n=1 Tax=Paenibacillus sp. MZ04-78.2 TaxID=2962034 RepID=UPI0020B68BF3|nr:polyphosphate polymerase domain-containing protein [Paenibacillus sp. MZ04-78.2]MCP3774140.1 polyphosphate polymerase domain-containing protein [Paenibacillus sp. MZ04-78.2]
MQFFGRKLRHELKYYIHSHDYAALRQRLSATLTLDGNSGSPDGYGIRSLYFDGPHNHALYDKSHGIFSREKYRIRIYNGSDRTIKLERKSKYGDYVCKEAARLSRDDYERILDGDVAGLQESKVPLVQDFYRAIAHRGFRPAVIVDYTREAYVYDPGDVRITFDKRLAAAINTYDLFSGHMVMKEALEPARTIMEIKYNAFLPDFIRALVQPQTHQRSAISKYLICREVGIRSEKP